MWSSDAREFTGVLRNINKARKKIWKTIEDRNDRADLAHEWAVVEDVTARFLTTFYQRNVEFLDKRDGFFSLNELDPDGTYDPGKYMIFLPLKEINHLTAKKIKEEGWKIIRTESGKIYLSPKESWWRKLFSKMPKFLKFEPAQKAEEDHEAAEIEEEQEEIYVQDEEQAEEEQKDDYAQDEEQAEEQAEEELVEPEPVKKQQSQKSQPKTPVARQERNRQNRADVVPIKPVYDANWQQNRG